MRFNLAIILLFLVLSIAACYEPQEGCLDPNAVNYDPSADIDVNCNYPAITLNYDSNGPEGRFSYDSVYIDQDSIPYQFVFVGVFLQPLEIRTDGEFVSPSGIKRNATLLDGSIIEYAEDVSLLEPRIFTNTIDSIVSFEAFDGVRTYIGLGALSTIDTASLANSNILLQSNRMIAADGFYDYVVVVDRDTSEELDELVINGRLEEPIPITFSVQDLLEPAQNVNWRLEVYYDEWLSDFRVLDSQEEHKRKLEDNFQDFLSIVLE